MVDQEMLDAMKTLLEPIDDKVSELHLRLNLIDARLVTIDSRIENIDMHLSDLEDQFEKGFKKLNRNLETIIKISKNK